MMRRHGSGAATDETLLELAVREPEAGESRRAASALLSRYQRQVYAWCLRYAEDHERALDMSQEVLARAYTRMASFAGHSRFASWLFVVTRNHCLNAVKRPRLLTDDDADPDDLSSRDPDPEQALLEKLDEGTLLDLIESHLDPTERRALWLRCFERMPVAAITKVLELESSSGARAVLQSGRRKLRNALDARRASEKRKSR